MIYNVTVVHEGKQLRYEQLCAHWNQYCYDNEILRMDRIIPEVESGDLKITYPFFFDPYSWEQYKLPIFFGGVQLDRNETFV